MNCLIVDDDAIARSILTKLVKDSGILELVAAVGTGEEALKLLNSESIDLLFLDIELSEMTGYDILNSLSDPPLVIVVSASAQNAASAFDYNVVDFLLKPLTKTRFLKSLSKIQGYKKRMEPIKAQSSEHLFIKKNDGYVKVDLEDILFVEADSDYVHIHATDGKFIVTSTLANLHEQLPQENFVRTHRSYLVNIDHIKSYEENHIQIGDKTIPVSKTGKKLLMEKSKFI